MCFFNHKVFSTTFGRVLNDEIRGSFPPFWGGIGVGLVECMLPNPEIAGIVPAPNRPWDIKKEPTFTVKFHGFFLPGKPTSY